MIEFDTLMIGALDREMESDGEHPPPDPDDAIQPSEHLPRQPQHGNPELMIPIDPALNTGDRSDRSSQRRRREDSDSDTDNGDETYHTARATQRRIAFMEELIDREGIRGKLRDECRAFAKQDDWKRELSLFVSVKALRAGVVSTATRDFLLGKVYKNHVLGRLRVALMLPHLTQFVKPLQEWVIQHMRKDHKAWRIPNEVAENAEQLDEFTKEVKGQLTTLRSNIKKDIRRVITSKGDIHALMQAIVGTSGIQVSEEHRAKWAWVAMFLVKHDKMVANHEKKEHTFWDDLGTEIEDLEKEITSRSNQALNTRQCRHKLMRIYKRFLAQHRVDYPTSAAPIESVEPPPWQETLESVMENGMAVV